MTGRVMLNAYIGIKNTKLKGMIWHGMGCAGNTGGQPDG